MHNCIHKLILSTHCSLVGWVGYRTRHIHHNTIPDSQDQGSHHVLGRVLLQHGGAALRVHEDLRHVLDV